VCVANDNDFLHNSFNVGIFLGVSIMAILFGTSGDDNIFGTSNNDDIFGREGSDNIYGGLGNDNLFGESGNDNIYGDSGNDNLGSGDGLDVIYGGEGDDILNANGQGDDQLFGGMGNDSYYVSRTTDSIIEASNQGIDTVKSSVTYNLSQSSANVENLVLSETANINGTGNSLDNQITGNSGNNILIGSIGKDTLSGLDGNDALLGGAGNDILTGGSGSDQFVFDQSSLPGAGVDTITDFDLFSDKIILGKTIFSSLETGAGSPAMGGSPLEAGDFSIIYEAATSEATIAASSLYEIVYNPVTGSLFYNPNANTAGFGADGGLFATIVGSPDYLDNGSFRVIF
jgi:Ca2+-binding RTX toxin-like protein